METKSQAQPLTDVLSKHSDNITAGELESILNAVEMLKKNSGWGEIKIIYFASDLNKIEVVVSQKFEKKKNEV